MNDQISTPQSLITGMFAYHVAANRKLWDCIDALTDAQFVQEIDYSFGSVRNHMVHLASAELRWIARIMDQPLPDRLEAIAYPDRAACRALSAAIEAETSAALYALSPQDLMGSVTYTLKRLDPAREIVTVNTRWQILLHVVNHATDHRAQLLRVLHDFGAPTFEQDYILYLWDQGEVDEQ